MLGFATISFLLLVVFLSIRTFQTNSLNQSEDLRHTKTSTNFYASQIRGQLALLHEAVTFFSDELTALGSEILVDTDVEKALLKTGINYDGFYSLGVAFEPREVTADFAGFHLYAPYLIESENDIRRIDSYYDYSHSQDSASGRWYEKAKQRQDGWGPALKEAAYDKWVLRYTKKLYNADGNVRGVIFLDIKLDQFRNIIENFDLWHNGYAIITNKLDIDAADCDTRGSVDCSEVTSTNILYHSLVGTKVIDAHLDNVFRTLSGDESEERQNSPAFVEEVEEQRLTTTYQSNSSIPNRITGTNAWFNRTAIVDGLSLLTIMDHTEGDALPCANDGEESLDAASPQYCNFQSNSSSIIKELSALDPFEQNAEEWSKFFKMDTDSGIITLIVSITILLTLTIIYRGFSFAQHSMKERRRDAIMVSFVMTIATIAVCFFQYQVDSTIESDSTAISNSAMVKRVVEEYSQVSQHRQYIPPKFIPTGLFVQSIEFNSATNVRLTGFVWQRFQKGEEIPDEAQVVFAEAISISMELAYTVEDVESDEIIKGWYFVTELNERFDYSYFPFDRQSIWIRIWSKNFGENIVLIPDFDSYDSLNPRALPGLEKDFPLFNWELEKSYFNMRINSYNSNFGQKSFNNRNAVPELYFNIDVRRKFLNPFISHLFPLIIVLLMLFAIIMTVSRRKENSQLLGFNVSSVVASSTALFFVLLIAHVQLREELSSDRIVYLEGYYFVSYLVILLTTANSILFTWDLSSMQANQNRKFMIRFINWLHYENNLIPKLFYWPFISVLIFFFTAFKFWS